jgi:MoaA/NifB/PqqE/SkfB family radical SAM enzyme
MDTHNFSDLLAPVRPRRVILELTLRCNLKCAYCESTLPEYRTERIDRDHKVLDALIDHLIQYKPGGICVSGYGETTIYKNWHLYCNRLLDAGIPLSMITNLAKNYSDDELDTLSRFSGFQVSCDTADPELFKELRLGNTLERFCGNMEKIRETARKAGRSLPSIAWSCVVCDKTVFGLLEYIQFGLKCGIKNFYMCNYATFLDVNHRLKPKRITEMAPDKFLQAAKIINVLKEQLPRLGIEFTLVQGLTDVINEKLESLAISMEGLSAESSDKNMPAGKPAQTRGCLEPWYNCFLRADGTVQPCCTYENETRLGPDFNLETACNSPVFKDLRHSLLTGDLKPRCKVCPHIAMVPVNDFQKGVRDWLRQQISAVTVESGSQPVSIERVAVPV